MVEYVNGVYTIFLNPQDYLLTPIAIALIFMFARSKAKKLNVNPAVSKYYLAGLRFKIAFGLLLAFVYIIYYGSGDTTNFYYEGAQRFVNLFYKNPYDYFNSLTMARDYRLWYLFDADTGWPFYFRDAQSFFVIKLSSLFALFSFGSYLTCTVLIAWFNYGGIWRIYTVFCELFPGKEKVLSYCILFLPTVAFWGSGLLKDTFTLGATGWFFYAIFQIVKAKKDIPWWKIIVMLGYSIWILVNVKAYILFGMLPGTILWLSSGFTYRIKQTVIRYAFNILLTLLIGASIWGLLNNFAESFGTFKVDSLLEKAVVTQSDLKQEYYKGSSFDIGTLEPTAQSFLSHSPQAIIAGLYRPYIYEAKTLVMLVSALENAVLLFLTLRMLIKTPWKRFNRLLKTFPVLKFNLVFFLFFSFSVGISTSNFGSLVRYKIPMVPFFVSFLVLLPMTEELLKVREQENEPTDRQNPALVG